MRPARGAGFVGLLALGVSIYGVMIQRQQVRAQVWPRLQSSYTNLNGGKLFLENVGVGPAIIRTVSVRLDDKSYESWTEVTKALALPDGPLIASYLDGRVLAAGATVAALTLAQETTPEDADRLGEIELQICYCSVLDECWVVRRGGQSAVKDCPAQKVPTRGS